MSGRVRARRRPAWRLCVSLLVCSCTRPCAAAERAQSEEAKSQGRKNNSQRTTVCSGGGARAQNSRRTNERIVVCALSGMRKQLARFVLSPNPQTHLPACQPSARPHPKGVQARPLARLPAGDPRARPPRARRGPQLARSSSERHKRRTIEPTGALRLRRTCALAHSRHK